MLSFNSHVGEEHSSREVFAALLMPLIENKTSSLEGLRVLYVFHLSQSTAYNNSTQKNDEHSKKTNGPHMVLAPSTKNLKRARPEPPPPQGSVGANPSRANYHMTFF